MGKEPRRNNYSLIHCLATSVSLELLLRVLIKWKPIITFSSQTEWHSPPLLCPPGCWTGCQDPAGPGTGTHMLSIHSIHYWSCSGGVGFMRAAKQECRNFNYSLKICSYKHKKNKKQSLNQKIISFAFFWNLICRCKLNTSNQWQIY